MTIVLQMLMETVQGLTDVGNQWQQRTSSTSPATTATHLNSIATVPKTVRLEFPRFREKNPSG